MKDDNLVQAMQQAQAAKLDDWAFYQPLVANQKAKKDSLRTAALTDQSTYDSLNYRDDQLNLSDSEVEKLSIPVWADAQRLTQRYRSGRPYPILTGRTVVIVDDGITTGYTMMAAAISARKMEPSRIVVAVPVASIEAIERLGPYVDDVLSLEISTSDQFSVPGHYVHYEAMSD